MSPRPAAPDTSPPVSALLERSNRLGADPRNTNYAGGNTSAKGFGIDPVTGLPVELLWVKGSGGDLGTLTEAGLAVLRLDRLRSLVDVYPGVEREDEMVAAFDFCLHGRGGAAPSIDTAMHGLVGADHVDHLHPDSGIALATAADGEELTRRCFGDRVAWVAWRRPGFQLGLDMAEVRRAHPEAIGAILGGHGITAWGDTSEACEARSLEIIRTAERFIADNGRSEPFGAPIAGYEPLPEADRHARAAALLPLIRGLASTDRPQVGHYTDSDVVLDFVGRAEHPRLAALGTSCPDHFLRTKVRPMVLDLPPAADLETVVTVCASCTSHTGPSTRPTTSAMRPRTARRCAAPIRPSSSSRASGCSRSGRTSRRPGSPASSTSTPSTSCAAPRRCPPIARSTKSEKFRIEYWALEEAKLAAHAQAQAACGRASRSSPAPGRGSARRSPIGWRPRVPASSSPTSTPTTRRPSRASSAARMSPSASGADVTDEEQVAEAFRRAVLAFGGVDLIVNNAGLSISKPLLETTVRDWDLQHDVMARGSFLVSREAARILIDQAMGGDIVYIVSKNAFFAGPNNVAYGASKADQAHQVRLLAAELGEYGIRVNGVNPDGVVRGSGIFAKGWGADRARTYGIPEDKLGEFYAQRTLLKREVLPEHVAAAVFALIGGDLSQTTGLHIPVDAGVAAAFLR